MAKKKTPAQLREEARKLIEQAQVEEKARHQKIGRMFAGHIDNGYKNFDMKQFKLSAEGIWRK